MNETMKPCPLCDTEKETDVLLIETEIPSIGMIAVQCQNCGFTSPSANTDYGATVVWNSLYKIIRTHENVIIDDGGCLWHEYDDKIRLLAADLEPFDADGAEENGYYLQGRTSLEVLKEHRYIE